jgi:hypothetical protein
VVEVRSPSRQAKSWRRVVVKGGPTVVVFMVARPVGREYTTFRWDLSRKERHDAGMWDADQVDCNKEYLWDRR